MTEKEMIINMHKRLNHKFLTIIGKCGIMNDVNMTDATYIEVDVGCFDSIVYTFDDNGNVEKIEC